VLLYVLGIAGILALPFLARNTYIDENAMLAGAARRRHAALLLEPSPTQH
jgi:hypothetical protein